MTYKYLTVNQVIEIHDKFLDMFGGLQGLRDLGLLESAVHSPKAFFDGAELYKTIFDKAAAYLFFICKNHPFNDGNKRTAAGSSLLFLRANGLSVEYDRLVFQDIVVGTAKGNISHIYISEYFKSSSKIKNITDLPL